MRPESIVGCPSGLEYMKDLDQVQVEQISKLPEEFPDWDKSSKKLKKYIIKNSNGQRIYYALQDSPGCCTCCMSKPLNTSIIDNLNKALI